MAKGKLAALAVLGIGLIIILGLIVMTLIKKKNPTAGLKVETTPDATVFVDNVQAGQTPLDKTYPSGEVTVKIVPLAVNGQDLAPYQTKVKLTEKVYTVIRRTFGKTDFESEGETITMLPQSNKTPSLAVNTISPDSASVTVDGQAQGFTPLALSSVSEGEHEIIISAPGFNPRTISAQAVANYKLVLTVKLSAVPAPTPEASPSAMPDASPSATPAVTGKVTPTVTGKTTPTPTLKAGVSPTATPKVTTTVTPKPTVKATLPKPYIEVLDTPTGFLRVRSGPGLNNDEIGQIKPGDLYPLLSTQSTWYQIKGKFEATTSGWVSSQYAKMFE